VILFEIPDKDKINSKARRTEKSFFMKSVATKSRNMNACTYCGML
jgi:hypothetical protein